ncbi:hypothetical protein SBA5_1420008 [Candidatus Sulfotelmatomonas gaucii]|uniref:Uncharacterized protein n=1 Tax=Candidatus Sulfuritelmatomonas gaucii TaxID=2043161 RepID=A0A2N9L4M6_9BACT|nr:hypothetical protein SBA5_1420008 [Candidatus Sulfotelmatomonas gaucii]
MMTEMVERILCVIRNVRLHVLADRQTRIFGKLNKMQLQVDIDYRAAPNFSFEDASGNIRHLG